MKYVIEVEQETDGRGLADLPALPGVMAYGTTADEAIQSAKALALRVLAERFEHGEMTGPVSIRIEATVAHAG